MKKIFKLVAVCAAVVACASCTGKGGEQNANDSTKVCCDSTKKSCCDSSKTDSVAPAASEDTTAAKREINANDLFARRMERLTKELILTDAQQAQLAEILTVGADRIEKYIAAQERPSIDEIKKFHAEEDAKVKAILKGDQFERFQKMEEEMHKKFEERAAAKAKAAEEAAKK